MMWRYSRRESKLLLLATLLMASGYALFLADGWHEYMRGVPLTANSVGVLVSIEDNGINTLAAQLQERELQLQEREAALVAASAQPRTDSTVLLLLTVIGFSLLGLIMLNFYFDSKRRMSLAQ